MRSTILMVLLGSLILFCSENPVDRQDTVWNWPVSTLANEGIDTVLFASGLAYIRDSVNTIRSVVVVRNGKLVFERCFHAYNRDSTFYQASGTKSVVGVLIGIAIKEGLIPEGVNAKILDFFPEMTFDNMSDAKLQMKLEDVLTHRAGLEWDDDTDITPFFNSNDPVKYVLDKPMDTLPGIKWRYHSGASHLLSVIISRVSEMSTCEFACEKLFKPLGITEFHWEQDRKGNVFGGFGLSLKTRDYTKVGLLMLNNGIWGGTEIIPETWVQTATDSIVKTGWPEDGYYGYQWWNYSWVGAFCTRGLYGQDMYVIREKNLIIAFNSYFPAELAAKTLNKIVKYQILPAVN